MAQLEGENLVVVPSTADGFRAAVSALGSFDGKDGVSFHTFKLPEDRCARLLVKNLGRCMPESVREKLESLNTRVHGVTQLRSGHRDPDPAKNRPTVPTSLYQWREGLRCQKCDRSPNFPACECRCSMFFQKARCNASAASASDSRTVTADTHPGTSLVGAPTSLVMLYPAGTASVLWLRRTPHSEIPWLCEVEGSEGSSGKASARTQPKDRRHRPTCCS